MAPAVASSEGPLVLVAEDDDTERRLLQRALELNGFQVVAAADGAAALLLARQHRPDLAVLDRMMPGMNGDELMGALQADPDLCLIKVVFLSARKGLEERLAGIAQGAVEYLEKPANITEIVARLRSLHRLRMAEVVNRQIGAFVQAALHAEGTFQNAAACVRAIPPEAVDPAMRPMLEAASEGIDALTEALRMLGQYLRLSTGRTIPRLHCLNLAALAVDAGRTIEPAATRRGVMVAWTDGPAILVRADSDLTKLIIGVLVENAVRYTLKGGRVDIALARDGSHGVLQVRDTGVGIPAARLSLIFEPGGNDLTKHGGQGFAISLATAAHAARALNGAIAVESEETKGSLFTLRLPLWTEA